MYAEHGDDGRRSGAGRKSASVSDWTLLARPMCVRGKDIRTLARFSLERLVLLLAIYFYLLLVINVPRFSKESYGIYLNFEQELLLKKEFRLSRLLIRCTRTLRKLLNRLLVSFQVSITKSKYYFSARILVIYIVFILFI
jgi:hypothetical protein